MYVINRFMTSQIEAYVLKYKICVQKVVLPHRDRSKCFNTFRPIFFSLFFVT